MSESHFNPLVFEHLLEEDKEETYTTVGSSFLNTERYKTSHAIYTQEEYDKLWTQYQQWHQHAKIMEENFFAMAEIMYQLLAYINGQRMHQGKTAIMANEVSRIIENNPILAEITNNLRQAAISSGYGLLSEFDKSQENLRQNVMNQWIKRFQSEERETLSKKLFQQPDNKEIKEEELF